ncbi:lantibiotic dehydratase [Demequina sp. TTPB684]|uniref:thiopeptide-type bacteriocin biosynthesis protein n=1 Tax=unclassified Demequina TaxID=2620311 RepID=UPI001CF285AB|nr:MULTISPECIES: thiopeptide-type bacteriocin biosynthesis protein [unclassified Demequina]MCB2412198.1 lantibiotic dehydratase [Demequina sp. TTPB684]UPU87328.1 lantibiotic dehydratase [Demequina sp. TMPB413]
MNVTRVTLPLAGAPLGQSRNVEGVVARLFRMRQSTPSASAKSNLSDLFLDRFGVGVRVPYRTAVDGIVGVGLINLEKTSASIIAHTRAAEHLLEDLVLRARAEGSTEVAIGDRDVDLLTDPARRSLGIDTDVIYSIDDVSGRVELANMPTTALSGQAVVRHWDELPRTWFDEVASRYDSTGREVEPVELWCFPRSRHILDVMHAPQVTERYISLSFADASSSCLTLDDIELIHDGGQVWLLARDSADPLVIRNLSMVNYPRHLSRDAQTLITLGRETERDWTPFNWASQSAREFLPGVVYRNVRISKPTWRLPSRLFRRDLSSDAWRGEFARWKRAMDLPKWMEFGAGDNLLPFDITDPSELSEIRRVLEKSSPVAFESGRTTHNQTAVEYVQHVSRPPVARTEPFPRFDSTPAFVPPIVRRDWLGFELVGGPDTAWLPRATQRVVNVARSLDVSDWHFVVYRDPDPHTRLRFHVGRGAEAPIEALREAVLSEVGSSVRIAREVPFLPEYHRYGGERSFDSIVRVFTQSSEVALRANVATTDRISRLETACSTAIESMEQLLGARWNVIVAQGLSEHKPLHVGRKARDEVLSKLAARAPFEGDPILNPFDVGSHPVGVAMSVLHMHANRVFAADGDEEAQMLSVLRSYVIRHGLAGERQMWR